MVDIGSPEERRDVIVQHVTTAASGGSTNRWMIFVGDEKRADLDDASRALVFARLLADLNQGRVFIRHGEGKDLQQVDAGSIRGCSCC